MLLMFLFAQDYTGGAVNVDKFFSVLLGNESGVTGGSGKVVKSGPLIYYADHELTGSYVCYHHFISMMKMFLVIY